MKPYFFYFLFLFLLISKPLFSQNPIPVYKDSIPVSRDTLQVPADTIRVARDSVFSALDVKFGPKTSLIKKPIKPIKVKKKQPRIPVTVSNWKNKNKIGFDLNQVAFVNWNAGGTSSVAGLLKGEFTSVRSDINSEWVNELGFRYGLNKQDGIEMRKSDDEFRLNSTFGYRKDTLSHWYYSVKFNFKTQFSNGYKYPDTEKAISKPFAPAYTFLGIGANYYIKKKVFDIYISPLTLKNTLVLDQDLADSGAFGTTEATYDSNGNKLTSGEKSRTELGFLVTNYYKKEIWKNITMENRLSLYSDYINNFGNIDVEWRLQFDMIVNQYVKANIGMHLIYDDDVKTVEEVNGQEIETGAKVQLKQALGIGLVYNF
nr:DUF3078 domain-containing protein [uncultured Flavobacterium sp.]